MSRIHPQRPDPHASDWPVAAGVFLRQELGEEDEDEDEDEDGNEDEDEDDDEGDGYSE